MGAPQRAETDGKTTHFNPHADSKPELASHVVKKVGFPEVSTFGGLHGTASPVQKHCAFCTIHSTVILSLGIYVKYCYVFCFL